ncbi:MAG: hypothetical protein ACJAWV_000897 [Flammeovirgaceae bacterium]|jgi:hypothetical protein
MKKGMLTYFKHLLITIVLVLIVLITLAYEYGGALKYDGDEATMNWDGEGPHIFYENDSVLSVNYIRGNKTDGFSVSKQNYSIGSAITAKCFYPLDSTSFNFSIRTNFSIPKTVYSDGSDIVAISDLEGNYKAFRDFLIHSKVIDSKLNWIFGKGHLVLVGDLVDRGFFSTQLLWFIYKLELEASQQGGFVHLIIGNHELKNMQGNFVSASPKYFHIASIMEKQQYELYGENSMLGKWLASKNAMEVINGNLFIHGGIHPDLVDIKMSLDEVNQVIRNNYRRAYRPEAGKETEQLILSSKKGICWYRGYFKDDLTQEEVEKGLNHFNVKSVIVGHNIQRKIQALYEGKVIAIDVMHPADNYKYFPPRSSEGLRISGEKYSRVLDNGEMERLKW